MFFVCYFYPPSIPGRYQGIFKGATITTAGKRATQKVVTRFEMRSLILNMSMGFVRKTKKKKKKKKYKAWRIEGLFYPQFNCSSRIHARFVFKVV